MGQRATITMATPSAPGVGSLGGPLHVPNNERDDSV